MLCGWNRGRRLSVIIDHQCRISHGCGGMARSAVCFARTLRHRASFVSPGMWWWGGVALATIRPGLFVVCAAPHGRPFLLAGGWEGERGESTQTRAAGRLSQLTSWTTDSALGAKARHEGGSHLFCGGGLLWLLLSGGRRESVCPPIVRVS